MIFHQTVAWGVNEGLDSFVDTLVMRRAFDALADQFIGMGPEALKTLAALMPRR